MADWIEDYVLDQVANKYPAQVIGVPQKDINIWGVSVERREDYYAVKVFSPKSEFIEELGVMSVAIEQFMASQGVTVVVYPQLRNGM
jgi:hypothetical protein